MTDHPFYKIDTPADSSDTVDHSDHNFERIENDQNEKRTNTTPSVLAHNHQVPEGGSSHTHQLIQYVDRWWLIELLAWSVCAACLIAIFAILGAKSGQTTPNWTVTFSQVGDPNPKRVYITINVIISIFSTIIKSALLIPVAAGLSQLKWMWFQDGHHLIDYQLFEAAKQGPLGALLLLWSLRGRRLACLGAFIVIAAVGLDFSLQALLTYPLYPVKVGTASVPRALDYSSGTSVAVASDMLAAIYSGLYQSKDKLGITPSCPTGNCTWEHDYTSLGVCSQCVDVSQHLDTTCVTYETFQTNEAGQLVLVPTDQCTYRLPNGLSLGGSHSDNDTMPTSNISSTIQRSVHFEKMHAPISVMSMLQAQWKYNTSFIDGDTGLEQTFNQAQYMERPRATECGLYFCAKRYRGIVESGVFHETVMQTFQNDSTYATTDESGPFEPIIHPSASFFHNTFDLVTNSDGPTFLVEWLTIPPIIQKLHRIFQGSSYVPVENSDQITTSDVARLLLNNSFDQISTVMSNLALSMTNNIRSRYGEVGDGVAAGAASQDLPHVMVRWGWLALPCLLLLATLVFLVATMVDCQKRNAVPWKTSALAAFFHPLTQEGMQNIASAQGPRELERVARHVRVRREHVEGGERLVMR